MPVYEFYCPDCHKIFNFMSRSINTKKKPRCPKCNRPKLDRQVSLFAFSKGLKEDSADNMDMPDIDEGRLEKAMEALAGDAENINEEDPKQMANIMRRLYDATGLKLGDGMDEAIKRLEAGDDPDKIEEELGDILEKEDPFAEGQSAVNRLKGLRKRLLPPSRDDDLYDL